MITRRQASGVGLGGALLIALLVWLGRSTPTQRFEQAQRLFQAGEVDAARSLAARLLAEQPHRSSVQLLLARVDRKQEDLHGALRHYRSLAGVESFAGAVGDPMVLDSAGFTESLDEAGEWALARGRFLDAELFWKSALQRSPDAVGPLRRLTHLLSVQGRCRESRPLLKLSLLRPDPDNLLVAVLLAAESPVVDDPELVARCQAALPDEPLILLGQAREALFQGQTQAALDMLMPIVARSPQQIEAMALLGLSLLEISPDQIPAWNRGLAPAASQHPLVWFVRSQWAVADGQSEAAIGALARAVRMDPTHSAASFQLAKQLQQEGKPNAAVLFRQRSQLLNDLNSAANVVFQAPRNRTQVELAMSLAQRLQRGVESRFWATWLLQQAPGHPAALEVLRQTQQPVSELVEDRLSGAEAKIVDVLVRLPGIQWPTQSDPIKEVVESESEPSLVALVDRAGVAGIDFVYRAGQGPEPGSQSILQQPGGGVAVIDYDNDAWPDLYFTQGGPLPPVTDSTADRDVLYRNRGDGTFRQVDQFAGLGDGRYSHGCAAGDFDNDGFADLYVANAGSNRLYRNNGDGTFSDASASLGDSPPVWTTSCAIADLNGDGLPDIFDVNYLDVSLSNPSYCTAAGGVCSPPHYAGVADRLLLGQGDGRFLDVSEDAGMNALGGRAKGLGVMITKLAPESELSLFVANDTVENFHLVRRSPVAQSPRFVDQAMLNGLAVDRNGFSQACMGIAAGDVNRDGRSDLFVTNFEAESNTLYVQNELGQFEDVAAEYRLRQPSLPFVAFGTQFIDVQNDGDLDIVVANGHVFGRFADDDSSNRSMRPQLFVGGGEAGFREIRGLQESAWLNHPVRGRGMARLDWNRDGRDDLAISNLGSRAALVTNESLAAGNWIAFALVGVSSSRDAVGACLSVTIDDKVCTQVLSAGDGYQACNQRLMRFGIGAAVRVDAVEIRWPAGHRSQFVNLESNCCYEAVEDRQELRSCR